MIKECRRLDYYVPELMLTTEKLLKGMRNIFEKHVQSTGGRLRLQLVPVLCVLDGVGYREGRKAAKIRYDAESARGSIKGGP